MNVTPTRQTTTQRTNMNSSSSTPSSNPNTAANATSSNAASQRQNRKLLFGSRAGGDAPASTAVNMENSDPENARTEHAMYENETKISSLGDRVGMMKEIAGQVHGDVQMHNEMLDAMNRKFVGAKGLLDKVMAGMKDMIDSEKEGNKYFWRYVGAVVLVCFLLFWFFKK